jgi:hypothetical protein
MEIARYEEIRRLRERLREGGDAAVEIRQLRELEIEITRS